MQNTACLLGYYKLPELQAVYAFMGVVLFYNIISFTISIIIYLYIGKIAKNEIAKIIANQLYSIFVITHNEAFPFLRLYTIMFFPITCFT